jgi:hypothetical protein
MVENCIQKNDYRDNFLTINIQFFLLKCLNRFKHLIGFILFTIIYSAQIAASETREFSNTQRLAETYNKAFKKAFKESDIVKKISMENKKNININYKALYEIRNKKEQEIEKNLLQSNIEIKKLQNSIGFLEYTHQTFKELKWKMSENRKIILETENSLNLVDRIKKILTNDIFFINSQDEKSLIKLTSFDLINTSHLEKIAQEKLYALMNSIRYEILVYEDKSSNKNFIPQGKSFIVWDEINNRPLKYGDLENRLIKDFSSLNIKNIEIDLKKQYPFFKIESKILSLHSNTSKNTWKLDKIFERGLFGKCLKTLTSIDDAGEHISETHQKICTVLHPETATLNLHLNEKNSESIIISGLAATKILKFQNNYMNQIRILTEGKLPPWLKKEYNNLLDEKVISLHSIKDRYDQSQLEVYQQLTELMKEYTMIFQKNNFDFQDNHHLNYQRIDKKIDVFSNILQKEISKMKVQEATEYQKIKTTVTKIGARYQDKINKYENIVQQLQNENVRLDHSLNKIMSNRKKALTNFVLALEKDVLDQNVSLEIFVRRYDYSPDAYHFEMSAQVQNIALAWLQVKNITVNGKNLEEFSTDGIWNVGERISKKRYRNRYVNKWRETYWGIKPFSVIEGLDQLQIAYIKIIKDSRRQHQFLKNLEFSILEFNTFDFDIEYEAKISIPDQNQDEEAQDFPETPLIDLFAEEIAAVQKGTSPLLPINIRKAEAEKVRLEEEKRVQAEAMKAALEEKNRKQAEAEKIRLEEEKRIQAEAIKAALEEKNRKQAEAEKIRLEEEKKRIQAENVLISELNTWRKTHDYSMGDFIRRIQAELNRIGCKVGPADGKIGVNTTRALLAFVTPHPYRKFFSSDPFISIYEHIEPIKSALLPIKEGFSVRIHTDVLFFLQRAHLGLCKK